MGSVLKTDLITYTSSKKQPRMKLQLAVLFACFLAFGTATTLNEAKEYLGDFYVRAQAILNKENIPFDIKAYSEKLYEKIIETAEDNNADLEQTAFEILLTQKAFLVGEIEKSNLSDANKVNLASMSDDFETQVEIVAEEGKSGQFLEELDVFFNF